MANLLLVDSDGRRRTHLDVAAQAAGHKTYAAGSAAEAIRMATIYVPEAVLIPGGPADPAAAGLLAFLGENEGRKLARMVVVTPDQAPSRNPRLRMMSARSARPEAMLSAVEEALAPAAEAEGVTG